MSRTVDHEISRVDPEEQLRIGIAWSYYIEGLTQKEIAERLGLTRARVNRLLAACRQSGVVQIRIRSRLADCIALERQLEQVFGLAEAIVVPASQDPAKIQGAVGFAAGHWISEHIGSCGSIGIGWGRTLRLSLQSIQRRLMPSLSVVSLLGSLTRGSGENTFEIAYRFADLFDAERYYLAAPVFASSEKTRDTILAEPELKFVYDKAKHVDLALLSVGDLSSRSLMVELTPVRDEVKSLQAAGAVGDILGHFLDKHGEPVDHSINRRVVALKLDDLRGIDRVVLASGGLNKARILRAVLRRKLVHVLIVDKTTAERLIAMAD